jgi:NACalpha-BTF3-like transcription factor
MVDVNAARNTLKKMGIATEDVFAEKVIIFCKDKTIIIPSPQTYLIKAGNVKTFNVTCLNGFIEEKEEGVVNESKTI